MAISEDNSYLVCGPRYIGGTDDAFMVKYTSDGKEVWTNKISYKYLDNYKVITVLDNGDYFLAGWTNSNEGGHFASNTDNKGTAFYTILDKDGSRKTVEFIEDKGCLAPVEVVKMDDGTILMILSRSYKGDTGITMMQFDKNYKVYNESMIFSENDSSDRSSDTYIKEVLEIANHNVIAVGAFYEYRDYIGIVHQLNPYSYGDYLKRYGEVDKMTDIKQSWANHYIRELVADKVLNGVGNKQFNPTGKLTKAQFIKMIVELLGIEVTKAKGSLPDCEVDKWYTPYIEAAFDYGLISVDEQNNFYPNENISRKAMVVIIVDAYEKYTGDYSELTSGFYYKDFDQMTDELARYVHKASGVGILEGNAEGYFMPEDMLTRDQGARVIYMLRERIKYWMNQ